MNTVIWVLQGLTALIFGAHGWLLLTRAPEMGQRPRSGWVAALPLQFARTLGVIELIGAAGVVLPGATGVLPQLVPAAAAGLVSMMVLAMIFHFTRREWPNIVLNLILGVLAASVVYGRLVIEPF